jgi:3-oxoacyl-[acyl-carrier protein] reductase
MNILITGISRGIGKELLRLAVDSSSITKIIACSSSDSMPVDSDKIQYLQLDFTDDKSIELLCNTVGGENINFLINNAGYLHQELFKNMDVANAKKMFNVNFWGPYQLIKGLLSNLISGGAHVVNIGSMGGFQGSGKFPGLAAYSSSKAALASMTECLAAEHKDENVSFNCLALGAVDTEMLKKAFPTYHAGVTAYSMASYIFNFTLYSGKVFRGKVLPVSIGTP